MRVLRELSYEDIKDVYTYISKFGILINNSR